MCGISGIKASGDQESNIREMSRLLKHRGPENTSFYNYKDYWLGHNRLRIIDIDNGDQPMFNSDRSVAIIFNGEIYNFTHNLRGNREDIINRAVNNCIWDLLNLIK